MNTAHIDPVTTEILRNTFISIAQDMNATLIRSAYTPIIYEGKDCSVALLDEHGDVLGQSNGLPLFLGNLEICVKLVAEQYGWDYFQPGDIFYMNDSYMTGTHLNDATVFAPVFRNGKRIGFSVTRAHWMDMGSKDPGGGMATHEIYQEGVRCGPTRIYRDGEPCKDVIDLLRRNSRFGHGLVGDLNAQVAAIRTGETRFIGLFERFGRDTVLAARDEIFRQSEQLEHAVVNGITDGVYTSEGFIDDDGFGNGPLSVKVNINVEGDEMAVDLEGTAPQAYGPVNCGFAQTVSAVRVAFKLLINPDRPVDGGTFKTLSVKTPKGSMLDAQEPAACQWYFTPLGLLIDLIPKALAPAMPDQVAGAHYGDSMVIFTTGVDPRKGNIPFFSGEPTNGGWGAFSTNDGQDSLINNVNGSFKDIPVEVFENKYPLLLTRYGFRIDSGGPGRYRGGTGTLREYQFETDAYLYLWFERSVTPAWGLFEGKDGAKPDVIVHPGTSDEQHLLKANAMPVKSGTVVTLLTGGGGGFGPPEERNPQRVRTDVIDRYLTKEAAERDYGVVLNEDLTVIEDQTAQRRGIMKAG